MGLFGKSRRSLLTGGELDEQPPLAPPHNERFPKNRDGLRLVWATFSIHSVSKIDSKDETFTGHVSLLVSWLDDWGSTAKDSVVDGGGPRVFHNKKEFEEGGHFDARVEVVNLTDWVFDEEWYKVEACPAGAKNQFSANDYCIVKYCRRVHGTFSQKFAFSTFPVDLQLLTIKLRSLHDKCIFVDAQTRQRYTSEIDKEFFYASAEWDIMNPYTHVAPDAEPVENSSVNTRLLPRTKSRFSSSGIRYSQMQCEFVVGRHVGHFVNNIMYPMFLLTLVSHAAAEIDEELLGERLSVTVTMLLALVAFKFVITQELPEIDTMTRIDRYVNLNFLWVFLILCENILGAKLSLSENTERVVNLVLVGLWVLINCALAWKFNRSHTNRAAREMLEDMYGRA